MVVKQFIVENSQSKLLCDLYHNITTDYKLICNVVFVHYNIKTRQHIDINFIKL